MFIILYISLIINFHWNFNEPNHSLRPEETYIVVSVSGTIVDLTQNITLKNNLRINASNKIAFKSPNAKAMVISSQKGRFVLAAPKKANTGSFTETIAFLKDVLIPVKKSVALSTRGSSESISDLRGYFGDSTFYIIGDKLTLNLNAEKYPITGEKFFVLRFIHEGNPLNKKIPFSENSLLIDKNGELFKSKDGQIITPGTIDTIEIYRYIVNPKSADKLAVFSLVFLEEESLKNDFQTLLNVESENSLSGDVKYDYLKSFFQEAYGKTDEKILKEWLVKNEF